jgi:putative copper export protein
MWVHKLIHSIPTFLDLLALTTLIGALGCRLWVFTPHVTRYFLSCKALLINIWRLLAVCIILLVLSSFILLFTRAAEMSSLPLATILPVLPKVLFKTHYGQVWLVRVTVIIALWISLLIGKQRLDSRAVPAFMLVVAAVLAFTRSASSHAADAGHLKLPEIMDWLHLMAASLWGGGLLVLSTVLLPKVIKYSNQRLTVVADIAQRFSALAGVALAGVILTGVYNAWLQVGSFQALWKSPYGQTLISKLLLLVVLIMLGASNRYISIPLLKWSENPPTKKEGAIYRLFVISYLGQIQHKLDMARVTRRFMVKVWIEAILILGVLTCAALLQHEIPARHFLHAWHVHGLKKSNTEEKLNFTDIMIDRTKN